MKDDHGEFDTGEVLLIFEIAINSEQNVEQTRSQLQEFTVFHARHPVSATVRTVWPTSSLPKARGTHSSSNTRIGDQVVLCLFESSNGELARHGGKVVKKFLQRMTSFNVVDEGL